MVEFILKEERSEEWWIVIETVGADLSDPSKSYTLNALPATMKHYFFPSI